MRISTGHQMSPGEILHYLGENFSRQAASKDLSSEQKIDALMGNIQLARKTIEENDMTRGPATAVFNTFQASVPAGKQFAGVKEVIIETGARYGLEL